MQVELMKPIFLGFGVCLYVALEETAMLNLVSEKSFGIICTIVSEYFLICKLYRTRPQEE